MKKLRHLRASMLKRIVAYNDDRVLPGVWDTLTIIASNARAMSGEEWEQITPWGEFPNRAGLQRVTRKQGEDMVKAFNSLVGKLKGAFRGVPIFCGHPDVDPENYKDDRRYGKIEGLEAREDGLYCKPAWNDLGLKNKEQGYWLYPSGVWKYKRCPGGVIEPTELVSVGLTNSPVIKEVQPWARNAKAANAGTSAGAHKGWATRRANGVAGAKNPRAVRALATMTAKKAGRKPTADDKAAAGDKLDSKRVSKGERAQGIRTPGGKLKWDGKVKSGGIPERASGSRPVGGENGKGHSYSIRKNGRGYSLHHSEGGQSHADMIGQSSRKSELYTQAEAHNDKWVKDNAPSKVTLDPGKIAAAKKETSDSLTSQAHSVAGTSPGLAERLNQRAAELHGDASNPKPTPPALPSRSASSSSGPGTHIHIHAGADTPAPAPAKRGLIASILDAFARPHVHDGGAVNALYFDENFYGRRRLVATNARKKTAAANANA